jgi:hypothetical protein
MEAAPPLQNRGHANIDVTLNVYTQVVDGSARLAVDRIGCKLFAIVQCDKSEPAASC